MIWYTELIVTRTCHHLSFKLKWVLSTESGTNIPPICPYRKWFGVNGTTSAGCDDWYVNGLLLIKPSAPTKAVRSSSSHHLYLHSPICFWSLFLAALTIISWTPQKCGAAGGLNDDWISLFLVVFWIFSWSSWFTKFLQSLSAFTKLLPMHENNTGNTPSTCNSQKCLSKWISIHLEWHLQMYCTCLQTSEQVNVLFCSSYTSPLYCDEWFGIINSSISERIQYFADKAASMWFVPVQQWPSSCHCLMISFVIHDVWGRITGYLVSVGRNPTLFYCCIS